jgi:4'-phosphopantetheinyl transferase
LALLSRVERERYEAATSAPDSYLAGRMLLRTLAGELTATPPAAVPLMASCPDCGGPHGQPAIVGSGLRLSLSHGEGVVVAAASWGSAVGVDTESWEASAERLAAIEKLTGQASVQHWMRVEAVLKADGRGLRVDPADVTIAGVEGRVRDSERRYEVRDVELEGVRVSVAVEL